eukprot:NODE_1013_length_1761_cov_42.170561_g895_i0.p1 GENE.NODE_1013_length_1761_cov_42.170561_g895_i0~~NODE_1013_length_1761_cov_42.170561_g895_i0.p1  ORF type:complete len:574 (+),score=64.16 NODE_1013_length_1761_cov_42.170561_g895_i0:205-1722(+)
METGRLTKRTSSRPSRSTTLADSQLLSCTGSLAASASSPMSTVAARSRQRISKDEQTNAVLERRHAMDTEWKESLLDRLNFGEQAVARQQQRRRALVWAIAVTNAARTFSILCSCGPEVLSRHARLHQAVRVLQNYVPSLWRARKLRREATAWKVLRTAWLAIFVGLRIQKKRRLARIVREILQAIRHTVGIVRKVHTFLRRVHLTQRQARAFLARRALQQRLLVLQWNIIEKRIIAETLAQELKEVRERVRSTHVELLQSPAAGVATSTVQQQRMLQRIHHRSTLAIPVHQRPTVSPSRSTRTSPSLRGRNKSGRQGPGAALSRDPYTNMPVSRVHRERLMSMLMLEQRNLPLTVLAKARAHELPDDELRAAALRLNVISENLPKRTFPEIRQRLILESFLQRVSRYRQAYRRYLHAVRKRRTALQTRTPLSVVRFASFRAGSEESDHDNAKLKPPFLNIFPPAEELTALVWRGLHETQAIMMEDLESPTASVLTIRPHVSFDE